ncbi:MAG: hypothetical protein AAF471_02620 [Myxococcota bacterium]
MSIANMLTQAGLKKGLERGKLEGKLETARGLLSEGISLATIARVTRLSPHRIRKLKTS